MFGPIASNDRIVLTRNRYYTASIIVGTLALAYGSVPLYKMVTFQFPLVSRDQ